jgi:predicted transcriptional regulator
MKKEASQSIPPGVHLHKLIALLEQLVAIQLYSGGANQSEIADNMDISVGKVNSLVKGMKVSKGSHAKK